jgi:hypothetical protein
VQSIDGSFTVELCRSFNTSASKVITQCQILPSLSKLNCFGSNSSLVSASDIRKMWFFQFSWYKVPIINLWLLFNLSDEYRNPIFFPALVMLIRRMTFLTIPCPYVVSVLWGLFGKNRDNTQECVLLFTIFFFFLIPINIKIFSLFHFLYHINNFLLLFK